MKGAVTFAHFTLNFSFADQLDWTGRRRRYNSEAVVSNNTVFTPVATGSAPEPVRRRPVEGAAGSSRGQILSIREADVHLERRRARAASDHTVAWADFDWP